MAVQGNAKTARTLLTCVTIRDFDFDTKWNFFATSRGKQLCDGIGRTVKRFIAKECLQKTTKEQILSTESMFQFAFLLYKGVSFLGVEEEEVDET